MNAMKDGEGSPGCELNFCECKPKKVFAVSGSSAFGKGERKQNNFAWLTSCAAVKSGLCDGLELKKA